MATNDAEDILAKLQRQTTAPEPAPTGRRRPGPRRGNYPATGFTRVTVDFRNGLWNGTADGVEGLRAAADAVGVPVVCLIEALAERYFSDVKLRAKIDSDAAKLQRVRRRLALTIRQAERSLFDKQAQQASEAAAGGDEA